MNKKFSLMILSLIIISMLGVVSAMSAVSATCPSGMVSYWTFNESSGITASDSVDSHPGTLMNGPAWTTGKVGNALQFDGNDYVSVGNLGSFYPKGTIEFWMNPAVVENYRNPLTTNYAGGNAGIRFEENSAGNFALAMGDDYGQSEYTHTYLNSGLSPNTWYHVVLTWDKTSNKVTGYLNGVKEFEDTQPIWPTTIPNVAIGGILWPDRSWKGLIDEVAIYNRALSPSEVQQQYQEGLAGEGYCEAEPIPSVPEFGALVGVLTVLGALGTFFVIRRK
jgi:hypothetical protein